MDIAGISMFSCVPTHAFTVLTRSDAAPFERITGTVHKQSSFAEGQPSVALR